MSKLERVPLIVLGSSISSRPAISGSRDFSRSVTAPSLCHVFMRHHRRPATVRQRFSVASACPRTPARGRRRHRGGEGCSSGFSVDAANPSDPMGVGKQPSSAWRGPRSRVPSLLLASTAEHGPAASGPSFLLSLTGRHGRARGDGSFRSPRSTRAPTRSSASSSRSACSASKHSTAMSKDCASDWSGCVARERSGWPAAGGSVQMASRWRPPTRHRTSTSCSRPSLQISSRRSGSASKPVPSRPARCRREGRGGRRRRPRALQSPARTDRQEPPTCRPREGARVPAGRLQPGRRAATSRRVSDVAGDLQRHFGDATLRNAPRLWAPSSSSIRNRVVERAQVGAHRSLPQAGRRSAGRGARPGSATGSDQFRSRCSSASAAARSMPAYPWATAAAWAAVRRSRARSRSPGASRSRSIRAPGEVGVGREELGAGAIVELGGVGEVGVGLVVAAEHGGELTEDVADRVERRDASSWGPGRRTARAGRTAPRRSSVSSAGDGDVRVGRHGEEPDAGVGRMREAGLRRMLCSR